MQKSIQKETVSGTNPHVPIEVQKQMDQETIERIANSMVRFLYHLDEALKYRNEVFFSKKEITRLGNRPYEEIAGVKELLITNNELLLKETRLPNIVSDLFLDIEFLLEDQLWDTFINLLNKSAEDTVLYSNLSLQEIIKLCAKE